MLHNLETHTLLLLECKQVTLEKQERFNFDRLKQMNDMMRFVELHPSHKAYFIIAFKAQFWKESFIYLLTPHYLKGFIEKWPKQSINLNEAKSAWSLFCWNFTNI